MDLNWFQLIGTHWFQHWFQPQRFLADILPSRGSWELKFLLGLGDIGGYVPPKRQPSRCIINEVTGILIPEANHAIFALIIYSRLLIYVMTSYGSFAYEFRLLELSRTSRFMPNLARFR